MNVATCIWKRKYTTLHVGIIIIMFFYRIDKVLSAKSESIMESIKFTFQIHKIPILDTGVGTSRFIIMYHISSYKSPGFYFLPSIPDLAFKWGRPLFKTRHLFSIKRNDTQHLIKAKLKQCYLILAMFCWYYVLMLSCTTQKLYSVIWGHATG